MGERAAADLEIARVIHSLTFQSARISVYQGLKIFAASRLRFSSTRHVAFLCGEPIRRLARHYGSTAEKLDFLLNCDIKHRLGRDTEGEEE